MLNSRSSSRDVIFTTAAAEKRGARDAYAGRFLSCQSLDVLSTRSRYGERNIRVFWLRRCVRAGMTELDRIREMEAIRPYGGSIFAERLLDPRSKSGSVHICIHRMLSKKETLGDER
jgi:hypothetical protein